MNAFIRFFALLSAFFTIIFSPSTTYEKKGEVTVLTYNILYDKLTDSRLHGVTELIREASPDSFGCQEVKPMSKQYLTDAFGEYDSFFVSDETSDVQYNALFWRKDRFTAVEKKSVFLSKTPDKPSTGWDARDRRMLQWVVLQDKETGCRYVHANTHLDNVGNEAKNESVKLIEKYLGGYDCPVVVSGDFNCRSTGTPIKNFLSMGWQNTMNMSGISSSTDTYHGYADKDKKKSPIDYIFVKGAFGASEWTINRGQLDGQYPSDHFPLSVRVCFDYTITAKQNYRWLKQQ